MKKQELREIYRILTGYNEKFQEGYWNARKGKNKTVREKGERDYESAMDMAIYHIEKSPEVLKLLFGENSHPQQKAIVWDEFISPNWFGRDLPRLLRKIDSKILELSDDGNSDEESK